MLPQGIARIVVTIANRRRFLRGDELFLPDMTKRLPLSVLINLIQETVEDRFHYDSFWITAEITDVKKYESKRWCFLKFIEKQNQQILAEMQGVFWANGYQHIVQFERLTRQSFRDGIEITCLVVVKFHARFGLKLEVLQIDTSFALGQMELQRQETMARLIRENAGKIWQQDDIWFTLNNQLELPAVLQRVALITAPNSDGQRDFRQELAGNAYGYDFQVSEFTCTLQGDTALQQIMDQLRRIAGNVNDYDVVAIVRGGGSQTDFAAFDEYELARTIAGFPVPVFTGIGHDRNTSIADLMARQFKTPTKVAAAIIDHNYRFECDLVQLNARLEDAAGSRLLDTGKMISRWNDRLTHLAAQKMAEKKQSLAGMEKQLEFIRKISLQKHQNNLNHLQITLDKSVMARLQFSYGQLQQARRLIHQVDPQTIIDKGFALIKQHGKIVAATDDLEPGTTITAVLKQMELEATITKKTIYEQTNL